MYVEINGERYTVSKATRSGGDVKLYGFTDDVTVSGTIQAFSDSGFLLWSVNTNDFARVVQARNVVTLTNNEPKTSHDEFLARAKAEEEAQTGPSVEDDLLEMTLDQEVRIAMLEMEVE